MVFCVMEKKLRINPLIWFSHSFFIIWLFVILFYDCWGHWISSWYCRHLPWHMCIYNTDAMIYTVFFCSFCSYIWLSFVGWCHFHLQEIFHFFSNGCVFWRNVKKSQFVMDFFSNLMMKNVCLFNEPNRWLLSPLISSFRFFFILFHI